MSAPLDDIIGRKVVGATRHERSIVLRLEDGSVFTVMADAKITCELDARRACVRCGGSGWIADWRPDMGGYDPCHACNAPVYAKPRPRQ